MDNKCEETRRLANARLVFAMLVAILLIVAIVARQLRHQPRDAGADYSFTNVNL